MWLKCLHIYNYRRYWKIWCNIKLEISFEFFQFRSSEYLCVPDSRCMGVLKQGNCTKPNNNIQFYCFFGLRTSFISKMKPWIRKILWPPIVLSWIFRCPMSLRTVCKISSHSYRSTFLVYTGPHVVVVFFSLSVDTPVH